MIRIRSVMTGYVGSPYYSNLYFSAPLVADVTPALDAVESFWDSVLQFSTTDLSVNIEGEVAAIDPVTGEATKYYPGTDRQVAGKNSGSTLPPATQGLIRLRTATVVGGRRVLGKFFVPALTSAAGTQVPNATTRGSWQIAADGLVAESQLADVPLVVWSRKNGIEAEVTDTSSWSQYAVLRSRRD